VWAIGDDAAIPQGGGRLAPPQAQAAVQEGRVAARNVLATIDGKEDRFENSSTGPLDSSWSWEAASPSTM
jgi:NADH:ubiquinone reductase (H+-translocating)